MNNIVLSNQSIVQTPLLLDLMNINTLEQALVLVQQQLQFFANDPEFREKIRFVFGEGVEAELAESLQQNWLSGDFRILSGIEIRTSEDLGGAKGAYSAETDTMYLSLAFLTENEHNIEAIASVLLEEAGHRIDAQVNLTDKQGDEGEHFSLVVRGESISDEVLAQLQEEDDHQVVEIDGENIAVETNNNTTTITGKIEWTDNQGNKHPVRGAVLEIMGLSSILETQADGTYQQLIIIAPDVSVKVFGIKVFAQSETFDIEVRENKDAPPYYYEFELPVSVINPGDSISLPDFVIPISNNSNTKAFSIYDAMYVAQNYTQIVRQNKLDIKVNFPTKYSNFDENNEDRIPDGNNNLNIAEIPHRDWDTLFHEYSHYLSAEDNLATREFIEEHYLTNNLIVRYTAEEKLKLKKFPKGTPKEYGIHVAWSEGIANYLGISIQEVAQNFLPQNLTSKYHIDGTNYSSLFPPGELYGSDTFIFDLEDKATEVKIFDSITGNFRDINSLNETQRGKYNEFTTINQSEANELTVARILWDLADNNQDIFESGLKD